MPTVRQRGDKYQAIVRIKCNGSIVHQESKTFATEQLASDKTLGTVRLTDLTPSIFSTFASRRRSEGAGTSTVKHNLVTAAGSCCVDTPT